MAVKKGYKQTEVGVIPEDWNEVRFNDLEPFITSGSRGWARYYSDRGELFIRITNMSRATIYLDLEDPRFVKLPTTSHEGARTCVQDGDLLISVTADIGIISWVSSTVPKPAYINQHIALVRLPLSQVDSKFSAYFLASSSPQKRFRAITDQGAKAGINLATVRDIPLAYPPTLDEQEAIAGALSDADAWIESLEQLIAKKRQIKQGAMQELLTGKRRLPGFSRKWETKRLGEFLVSHPQYGINAAAVPYSDKLPAYIRITDITEYGQYAPDPRVCVRASDVTSYFLAEGDLVIARTGASVGKSYRYRIADGPLVFAGFLIRIRPNASQLTPRFLEAYLASEKYWNWVRLMSMRSGQPGINGNEYAQLPIELPSIDEQVAIATVFSDMDTDIESLESKLAKAREVKQGMMQELLTGRIRLVPNHSCSPLPEAGRGEQELMKD